MSSDCLDCGGTGLLPDMTPCPKCAKEKLDNAIKAGMSNAVIPMQYCGVVFDKSFLPSDLQSGYGAYMEDLMKTIIADYNVFQRNILICSRPNSGKTIWAYNLISALIGKGYSMPNLMDLMQVSDTMYGKFGSDELQKDILYSRGLIVRLPADMAPWMIDSMLAIVERRVTRNGFTIFLFNGSHEKLEGIDRYGALKHILGNGSFHSVRLEDFYV